MFWKKAKPNAADAPNQLPPVSAPPRSEPVEHTPAQLTGEAPATADQTTGEPSGAALLLTDPSLAGLFASLSGGSDAAASPAHASPTVLTQHRAPRTIAPQNVRTWNDAALGLGEVMSVLQRSPRHRQKTLADLDWMILPALRYGQYRIAKDAKRGGMTPPEAVIAWAKVSPAVDTRIMANPHQPIHLALGEWQSGDIVWIIDAAGSSRVIAQMMQQLAREILQVPVKFRAAGPQGVLQVRILNPEKVHKLL
jgi:hemolysin-activating ACP:hemolysin acyltransferase